MGEKQWKLRSMGPEFRVGSRVALVTLTCLAAALVATMPISADSVRPGLTVTSASRGFLPGAPGVRLFDSERKDQQISEEMVVRILYRTLQEVTADSGKPLAFELSGFSTLYPRSFSKVHWAELVTPQGGRHLKIERVEAHAGGGAIGITYEPSWTTVASDQPAELVRLIQGRSVSELFTELASQEQNLSNVVAVTRYRVTASFEGASRVYNAAVLWLDPDRDGLVTLAVQDNITERVDEAVLEKLRAAPRAMLQATASKDDGDGLESIFGKATSCDPHEWTHQFQRSAADTTGHLSGGHESRAWFNFKCQCDSTCRSTCLPSVTENRCNEIGTIQGGMGTHKQRTSTNIANGTKLNTDFIGADCGAGWACYIQYCPLNVCSGFTISVNAAPLGVGVGITFNASSQPLWDGQLSFPFQCDGCSRGEPGDGSSYQIENQDTSPPSGGGGGGGWGGDSCFFTCTSRWDSTSNTHYEECVLIC